MEKENDVDYVKRVLHNARETLSRHQEKGDAGHWVEWLKVYAMYLGLYIEALERKRNGNKKV